MNNPAISVILPVYNSDKYLARAIDSILQQTFADFECIVIDDGSTDNSATIIHSYTDNRIIKAPNEGNRGLIYSLNKGIAAARGGYIARMDADDICMPERLMLQKKYLDENPGISVVASAVIFINEEDKETGTWPLDASTITPHDIKKRMPAENCIAHPTVMYRAAAIKSFGYKPYQKNIEDYDLWLRMLNRRYAIAKISTPLLLYRVHSQSVTGTVLRSGNFFYKHAAMKWRFLWHELFLGKINFFTFRVKISMLTDLIKGTGKAIKQLFRK